MEYYIRIDMYRCRVKGLHQLLCNHLWGVGVCSAEEVEDGVEGPGQVRDEVGGPMGDRSGLGDARDDGPGVVGPGVEGPDSFVPFSLIILKLCIT